MSKKRFTMGNLWISWGEVVFSEGAMTTISYESDG